MYHLDVKDKKISYELDTNARQTYSQIARKVGLSKEVVRYRVENLIKNNVIQGFLLVADLRKLGLFYNKVFISLQNISEKEEAELIAYLLDNKKIAALFRTDGEYDLFFSIVAKDMEELNETLSSIENKFGHYFNKKIISTILEGHYFHRDYLIDKKRHMKPVGFGLKKEMIQIDEIDKKILILLSYNPRISFIDVAKKINLSADGVRLRIKKLEQNGIIQNYILILNNKEIGRFHYKILLDLKDFTEKSEKSLLQFCREHPNIHYACKTLTPWKFEIDMEVQTPEQYRELLKEIKNNYGDIIRDANMLQVYEICKYNLLPSL